MNINPFELLKNMKNIQEQMKELQGKIDTLSAVGSAGGDMVVVEIDGQMMVRKVTIAPEAAGDLPMLEDLVRSAFIDAVVKIKERLRQEMTIPGMPPMDPSAMGMPM